MAGSPATLRVNPVIFILGKPEMQPFVPVIFFFVHHKFIFTVLIIIALSCRRPPSSEGGAKKPAVIQPFILLIAGTWQSFYLLQGFYSFLYLKGLCLTPIEILLVIGSRHLD